MKPCSDRSTVLQNRASVCLALRHKMKVHAADTGLARRPLRVHSMPGLTLLELLVVVAIISILAALLLPALVKAKAKARQIQCVSQQKQWSVAFFSYVDDQDDRLIPREGYEPDGEVQINNWSQVAGAPLPSGDGKRRDSDDVWYNALPSYLDLRPASFYASPTRRREFYERGHLFHCPSARFPAAISRLNYQFALFSMAMNSHLIRAGEGPTIPFQRIENYKPSDTVLFLDNLLEGEEKVHPAQESTHLGQPASFANRFSARHGRAGNLAFADGHIKLFPGQKVVETDDASPLRGGPIPPPKGEIIWELPFDR